MEVEFSSTELPGIRGYLVFQLFASMPLMLLVRHHASPLSGWSQLVLSLLLWAMATAWSGMLESKRWSVPLELARVLATGVAVTVWLMRAGAPEAWSVLSAAWLVLSLGGLLVGVAGLTPALRGRGA